MFNSPKFSDRSQEMGFRNALFLPKNRSLSRILKATGHHPNAGEDKPAEADDRARIHGERLERSHERLSPGEVHRSLGVSDNGKEHEGEGNQSRRLETLNGTNMAMTAETNF
jgi:hypothetical protein